MRATSFGRASCAREVGVPGTASAGSTLLYAVAGARTPFEPIAMRWAFGVATGLVVRMVGVRGVDGAVVVREGVRGTVRTAVCAMNSAEPSSHADEEGGGRAGPEGCVLGTGRS